MRTRWQERLQSFCIVGLLCITVLLSGCGMKVLTVPSLWPVDTNAKGYRVAQTAASQIGARYRMGGTTPRGFDCSGLIWWAYRQHRVNVPRITKDQARAGVGVSRHAMRPGDILVFNTGSGRTGLHTGLYTGNGQFIHSPSSGKRVRRDSLSLSYWDKRLIRVRRILR